MKRYAPQGFTLIELLVVVLVIGILAAVAVPQYYKIIWKAKAIQARTATKKLIEAFELYDLDNGEYPIGQFHGSANKPLLELLDIHFSKEIYSDLIIHLSAESAAGYKICPVYICFSVKNPDFGICAWVTPNVKHKNFYKRPLCVTTTSFGDSICKNLCKTETTTAYSIAGYTKGCLL